MQGNSPPRTVGGGFALTKKRAADELSMSVDTFERYVQPDLKLVRVGRKVLVPVTELELWLKRKAAQTLETSA
jgi:hypothetical protein